MEILDMWRTWLSRLRQGRLGPPTLEDLKSLGRMARELGDELIEQFPALTTVPRLGYEEALGWFAKNKPDDARAVKGAMLRTRGGQRGWTITQVFLDAQSALVLKPDGAPYGRRIDALELDDELQDLFGDDDLVVVE